METLLGGTLQFLLGCWLFHLVFYFPEVDLSMPAGRIEEGKALMLLHMMMAESIAQCMAHEWGTLGITDHAANFLSSFLPTQVPGSCGGGGVPGDARM